MVSNQSPAGATPRDDAGGTPAGPRPLQEPTFDGPTRDLLETIEHALVAITVTGTIRYANRALAEMLARPQGELIGQQLEAFYHPDEREEALASRRARLEGRPVPYRFHRRLVRPDGGLVEAAGHSTPLVRDGEVTGFLAVYADATEQMQRDRALAQALEEESAILRAAPMPIILIDETGRVLRSNPATARVFGWTEESLAGIDVGVLAGGEEGSSHAEHLRRFLATEQASTPGGGAMAFTGTRLVTGRRRDGTTFPAELMITEISGPAGGARRFVGIVQDLTERERAEQQLRAAQKSESLAQLVSGVAHDFNNLLTVIGGALDLAQGRDPEVDRWLAHAQSATGRAATIVRQLLQYARREPSERDTVDVVRVAEETVALLALAIDRRIAIKVHADEALPPIVADRSQIEQVLMNVLVNARDAIMERLERDPLVEGRITVRLGRRQDEGREVLAIGVHDNGSGISPEIAARVFDPFFTTKRAGHGTGLGLSMSYGIVRSHGGDLTVASVPGAGTLFEITLPVTEPSPARAEVASPGRAGAAVTHTPRVLVVDDEEGVLSITRRMLEAASCMVVTSGDGRAALDAFAVGEFDLVLLDVNMPRPNGWATLGRLLAMRPEQPVLMMSGDCSEGEARSHGAAGVVHKPFHSSELVAAVLRAVQARGEQVA